MALITYKSGYRYQLHDDYTVAIDMRPDADIVMRFIELTTGGTLTIKKGYAWDGPSGPAVDTCNFMRGSMVHDALYELMRYEKLDRTQCKEKADQIMKDLCREDGMSQLRAWWVHKGVDWFGGLATKRGRPVRQAPCD